MSNRANDGDKTTMTDQHNTPDGRPTSLLDMPLTPRPIDRDAHEMKVVALASCKGGTGKTTLAASLAVAASLHDEQEVVVIDTDPLGALNDWWTVRRDNGLRLVHATPDRLEEDLAALEAAGISLVIIDTPTGCTATMDKVLRLADLALVPTRPGPHDLRAIGPMMSRLDKGGPGHLLVLNGGLPNAQITSDMRDATARLGQLADCTIHMDPIHIDAMIGGRSAMEHSPGSQAANDILDLWAQVAERLDRLSGPSIRHDALTETHARQASGQSDTAQTPTGRRLPPRPRHTPPAAPRLKRNPRTKITVPTLSPQLAEVLAKDGLW
ncbi:MAG: hypothetical protein Alpg2KO_11390 [Alphaproteobacteria bacterium]